ncbi:hypothetical protein KZZ52_36740 [Dactylosporangium sp. AC04546]|uniref:hypothetical protein n=1 Tax=Dactylosporangium sp. AC04546 TaxID=2862460 RepID=UPI001EE04EAD|nr:hypothetical protein [Dactylosporangium sp. AC04546]WVK79513.1 hypothetical protein KZZ52_36740 [Dactylosporangium sp. AC04546]
MSTEAATHTASLAVWGLQGPVEAGHPFTAAVGGTCNAGCVLTSRQVEIVDADGATVARAELGDTAWPGTANLVWGNVELVAPQTPGTHQWTARIAAPGHAAAQFAFSVASVPAPRHQLTVQVLDGTKRKPLKAAHVGAGPVHAVTDGDGRATLLLPPGDVTIQVWKQKYSAAEQALHVGGDAEVSFTIRYVPDKDPQYVRDFWA